MILACRTRPLNDRETIFWADGWSLPDETRFTLRQVDQARCNFAILETEHEAIHVGLACTPTRADMTWTALGIILATTGVAIRWIEVLWRSASACTST